MSTQNARIGVAALAMLASVAFGADPKAERICSCADPVPQYMTVPAINLPIPRPCMKQLCWWAEIVETVTTTSTTTTTTPGDWRSR